MQLIPTFNKETGSSTRKTSVKDKIDDFEDKVIKTVLKVREDFQKRFQLVCEGEIGSDNCELSIN